MNLQPIEQPADEPAWTHDALSPWVWVACLMALVAILAEATVVGPMILAWTRSAPPAAVAAAPAPLAVPDDPMLGWQSGFLVMIYEGPELNRPIKLMRRNGPLRFPLNSEMGPDIPVENMSLRISARLRLPQTGEYRFWIFSDDGARLWVDGNQVFSVWPSPTRPGEMIGPIALEAGTVPFVLDVSNTVGPGWIGLEMEGPGFPRRYLQGSDFIPEPAAGSGAP